LQRFLQSFAHFKAILQLLQSTFWNISATESSIFLLEQTRATNAFDLNMSLFADEYYHSAAGMTHPHRSASAT